MYSRNNWEKREDERRGYSLPPGYDGSRFRRRRRKSGNGYDGEDEVILIPDSGFAPVDDITITEESSQKGELSVGGIPTERGLREKQKRTTSAESAQAAEAILQSSAERKEEIREHIEEETESPPHHKEKLSGLLEKLGFTGGLSSDELLLCAVIFIIASDREDDGKSVGDILLILALLLGIR